MRRIPTILGAIGVATLSAMAIPLSAQASEGILDINGTTYENPSGCITVAGDPQPLEITNNTDRPATAHLPADCTEPPTGTVHPGEQAVHPGASVNADPS